LESAFGDWYHPICIYHNSCHRTLSNWQNKFRFSKPISLDKLVHHNLPNCYNRNRRSYFNYKILQMYLVSKTAWMLWLLKKTKDLNVLINNRNRKRIDRKIKIFFLIYCTNLLYLSIFLYYYPKPLRIINIKKVRSL
jgi:hypothetical protein